MKILFISDIHGIKTNLEYIKELDKYEKFDKIVILGDLYYNYRIIYDGLEIDHVYVKKFLMSYKDKIICLRGNCDFDSDIEGLDFPVCDKLALIHIDGLDIYCTHGNEYNIDNSRKFNRSGILIYGHEHYPYIIKKDDMVFINTGSISLPKNNSKPSYVIYENRKFTIYDVEGNIVDEIII